MRSTVLLIAVVLCAMSDISPAEADNTKWFSTILKANEFADGQIGEAPGPSQFWLAYQEALVNPEKISEAQLRDLQEKATPEGKLYAACLMYYSRSARKNAGDQDQGFKNLTKDRTKVFFRSGCRGTNTTVGEVATSLLKDRKFLVFTLEDSAKMKGRQGIPEPILKLSSARRLESNVVGEGSKSVLYSYYNESRQLPLKANGREINWLSQNGTPAGKLYGCFLAFRIDADTGISLFRKLMNDDSKVQYQSGCEVETFTVSAIARQFVEKRKFVDFEI